MCKLTNSAACIGLGFLAGVEVMRHCSSSDEDNDNKSASFPD